MDFGKQNNLGILSKTDKERSIACNAIIVKTNDAGEKCFLLGLRAKHKSGGGQWGLIGGTQAMGETMEETIVRELKEEINITVNMDDVKWNNFFQCISTETIHLDHHGFVIEKWKGEIVNNEPNKCDDLRWFCEKDLPLDNFFVSKGNLVNYLNNQAYNPNTNFNHKQQR